MAKGRCSVVLHPVAVHYKGSGFYSTDYGRKSKPAAKDGAGSSTDSSPVLVLVRGEERKRWRRDQEGRRGVEAPYRRFGAGGPSGFLPGTLEAVPPRDRLQDEQQHDGADDREQERPEAPPEAHLVPKDDVADQPAEKAPTTPTASVGTQPIA